MRLSAVAVVPLALALATLTACSGDADGPAPESTGPIDVVVPSVSGGVWTPAVPDAAVNAATVTADYTAAVDALVAAASDAGNDGLTWSEPEVRTEEFEGTCAVTLESVGTGPVASSPDDLQPLLAFAASDVGFDDLAAADDPGGAVRFVGHDDADALLEYRSKDTTTVAVRVATVATDCG